MIIRGPFTLTWGGNTLEDIEAVEVEYERTSDDYESGAGNVYEINKGIKAGVRLTLLASDIASLAAILPQYFVPNGGSLGDGSLVNYSDGAIDVISEECDTEYIYNDLVITSCGNPQESVKLINARTIIDSIEVGKIRKIVVKFIGEAVLGHSIIQFIGAEELTEELFLLGDGDLFALGNGENLLL